MLLFFLDNNSHDEEKVTWEVVVCGLSVPNMTWLLLLLQMISSLISVYICALIARKCKVCDVVCGWH